MAEQLVVSADAEDFVALLGKTSRLEPALRKALRKKVRQAGVEAAKASKEEVLKPPLMRGKQPRHRGLRAGIAKGIKVQLAASAGGKRVGVILRSGGSGLPAGKKTLPRKWNSRSGFRHPLFGDEGYWYTQRGRPYWSSVLVKQRDVLARRVREALDEGLRQIN